MKKETLLKTIANVSNRLEKRTGIKEYAQISERADFLSKCTKLDIPTETAILLMYSKGIISKKELDKLI